MSYQTGKSGSITLDQLRTLVRVAEKGSYEIDEYVTRSSASNVRQKLGRLATAAGDSSTPLAVPAEQGRVVLTERGRQMLLYATSVIGLLEEIPNIDRRVRVAAYSSLMLRMLQRAASLPEPLSFEFAPADSARAEGGSSLNRRLANHDIDIAVAPSRRPGPGQQEYWLYSWELRAVGQLPASELSTVAALCRTDKPADEQRPAVRLEHLAQHPLLVSPPGYRSRTVLESSAESAGLSLLIRYELADQGLMHQLTEVTDWIAVMPDDAYGIRDSHEGMTVVAGTTPLGGAYSLYVREPSSKKLTDFEKRVLDTVRVIVNLFRPEGARPPGSGGPAPATTPRG